MALDAKLIADFSAVPREADKAVAALGRMDAGAVKVTSSLNRIQPPPGLPATTQGFTSLGQSLSQVDSILALFGVHIGPEIKALAELGAMSTTAAAGLTATSAAAVTTTAAVGALQTEAAAGATAIAALGGASVTAGAEIAGAAAVVGTATTVALGPFAVAALAVATAVGAWKFTTAIGEWSGLTDAIGNATAKLMGWGDVAAMSAAARADVLAKASKLAGHEITNLAEAMGYTKAAADDAAAADKKVSDAMDRVAASALNAQDLAKWNAEIAELDQQGLLPDLTADINSHNFSMGLLAERYHISAEALAIFAKEAAEVGRITENNTKKLEELRLAEIKAMAERQAREAAEAAARKKKIYDEVDAITAADKAHHDLGVAADDAQTLAKKKTDEETAALKAQEEAAKALARAMGNTMEFDLKTAAGRAQFLAMNPGATVNAPTGYFDTHSLADAVRDGLVNFYSHYATQGGAGSPSLVAGAPPLVATRGGRAAGDTTVNVNVNGVFDPKSQKSLAGAVGTALANAVFTGRAA